MRHDSALVKLIAHQIGMSPKLVRRGLDELIEHGHLERHEDGYRAILPKDKPPADQAEGLVGMPLESAAGPRSSIPTGNGAKDEV